MEMILALVVAIPFLLFCFALGKGVEEGVLRHYQDDEIIITTYIVEDEDEEEEEIDDEEDDDKVK